MEEAREIGDWLKISVLGSGSFGVVSLWKNKTTDEYIAIKKSRPDSYRSLSQKQRQRWINEVKIMQSIKCETIVNFIPLPKHLEDELKKYNPSNLPLLSMEYCSNGNLRKLLTRPENINGLQETDIRNILQDISKAVEYLHGINITHRDIKPENIVLQKADRNPSGVVYKLIDLGYAKELSTLVESFVGTLHYLAPEIFSQDSYKKNVDYWSLGLVAFEIITGVLPFLPNLAPVERFSYLAKKASNVICIYKISSTTIIYSSDIPKSNHISQRFKEYMEGWLRIVLQFDPEKRGIYEDSSKNVFNDMQEILEKKIINVFSVYNYEMYSYEVTDGLKMFDLKQLVENDTHIQKDDQYFVTDNITWKCNNDAIVTEFLDQLNHETTLYLFAKVDAIKETKIILPDAIKRLLESGQMGMTRDILRTIYIHSLYFINQEKKLQAALIKAWNLYFEHLKFLLSKEKSLFMSLRSEMLKLMTEVECYARVNQTFMEKMDHKNEKHVHYITMYRKYLRQSKELVENVNSLTKRCLKLHRNAATFEILAEKVKTLFHSNDLQVKHNNAIQLIQHLSKDDCSCKNMAKIVSEVIKLRRKTLQDDDLNRFILSSYILLRKVEKIFVWINALFGEIQRVSSELCSNECEKNDLIFEKITQSIPQQNVVFANEYNEAETKLILLENQVLRYKMQDTLSEGFALMRKLTVDCPFDVQISNCNGVHEQLNFGLNNVV